MSSWYLMSVASPAMIVSSLRPRNYHRYLWRQILSSVMENAWLAPKPLQRTEEGLPPASPAISWCTCQSRGSPTPPTWTSRTRWLCHQAKYPSKLCHEMSSLIQIHLYWLLHLLVESLLDVGHTLKITCCCRPIYRCVPMNIFSHYFTEGLLWLITGSCIV